MNSVQNQSYSSQNIAFLSANISSLFTCPSNEQILHFSMILDFVPCTETLLSCRSILVASGFSGLLNFNFALQIDYDYDFTCSYCRLILNLTWNAWTLQKRESGNEKLLGVSRIFYSHKSNLRTSLGINIGLIVHNRQHHLHWMSPLSHVITRKTNLAQWCHMA